MLAGFGLGVTTKFQETRVNSNFLFAVIPNIHDGRYQARRQLGNCVGSLEASNYIHYCETSSFSRHLALWSSLHRLGNKELSRWWSRNWLPKKRGKRENAGTEGTLAQRAGMKKSYNQNLKTSRRTRNHNFNCIWPERSEGARWRSLTGFFASDWPLRLPALLYIVPG